MRVTMGSAKILSAEQIRRFLEASEGLDFSGADRAGAYQWIEQTLQRYHYAEQSKEARGVLREFLVKTTGLSVPQVTRLIGRYLHGGQVREQAYQRHRFARQYGKDDIVLLAGVDEAHGRLSGPAPRESCRGSGKCWVACRRSASTFWHPCWSRCWSSFPFRSAVSILTMVPSMSTARWPSCWRNCTRSSPSHDRAAAMTTLWRKPRTAPWCART